MAVFTYIATAIVTALEIGAAYAAFATSVIATGIAMVTSRIINGPGARGGGGTQDQGVRVQLPPATENKIPIIYGRAFQQPIITDARISADNKVMTYVLTLSELTQTGSYTFNAVYWNDQKLNFDTDGFTVISSDLPDGTTSTTFANLIKVYVFAGGSGSVFNEPIAGGANPGVNAYDLVGESFDYAMTDLVFAVIQLTYDSAKGVTGLPTMTFDVTNSLSNPGEVWVDYLTSTRYGAGIILGNIDEDSATGADPTSLKNISDEIPTNQYENDGITTSTQARYVINGILNTGDTVKNNIDRINLASSSWTTFDHKEGKWKIVVNRAATNQEITDAFVFDDDNIIGEISLTSTNLEDLYNQVEVQYANKNSRDQSDYYKSSIDPAMRNDLEPDNSMRMRLDLVNNKIHAGRIGDIELLQSRYDLIISFTADYSALVCEVGDVVKVTNPIYNFNNKLFRITRVRETEGEDGTLACEITALQYDADIYGDEFQEDGPDKPLSDIAPIISTTGLPPLVNLTATNIQTTVTEFVEISAVVSATSYPIDSVDIYAKPVYDVGGTYTYITTLVSPNGQWLPNETATGQIPLLSFEPEEYELNARAVYKTIESPFTEGILANLQYGTIQFFTNADNVLINHAQNESLYFINGSDTIGDYAAINADIGLYYETFSTSSAHVLRTPNLDIANTLTWNSYNIDKPTGGTTTFLRNDGTWAVPPGGGTGTSTATWATLGDKTGALGPTAIGLGQNAGGTATNSIAIGVNAGLSLQESGAIAIGASAAQTGQATQAISIGYLAGNSSQQAYAVSLGVQAGYISQGNNSVAIGPLAAYSTQSNYAIALGGSAGYQGQRQHGIAIGFNAGYLSQGKEQTPGQDGYAIAIGYEAGKTNQEIAAIAVGLGAGQTNQNENAVAIGTYAGQSNQGSSIAIGNQAGENSQGNFSIAIGSVSGFSTQSNYATAVGFEAGEVGQNEKSIALGYRAGRYWQNTNSIAIGNAAAYERQGSRSVAIGDGAGYADQGPYSIAIGYNAATDSQTTGSIVLSAGVNSLQTATNAGFYVNPIRNTASNQVLYYNTLTKEITYDAPTGGTGTVTWATLGDKTGAGGPTAIGLGKNAGGTATNTIAIGETAGQSGQREYSIALGYEAGQTNQGTPEAAQTGTSIAIGYRAGKTNQKIAAVALGTQAGETNQDYYSVAIGYTAGATNFPNNSVAIGTAAGAIDVGEKSVNIGTQAGYNRSGAYTVNLGYFAGTKIGVNSISIGKEAASLCTASNSIFIGLESGYYNTATDVINLGYRTGYRNQRSFSSAIGYEAGQDQGAYSLALGYQAGKITQTTGSIILSAGSNSLMTATNAGFYVNPIRNTATNEVVYYNTATKEVSYGPPLGGITQAQAEDIAIIYAIALG
jgi:hypothetical protein